MIFSIVILSIMAVIAIVGYLTIAPDEKYIPSYQPFWGIYRDFDDGSPWPTRRNTFALFPGLALACIGILAILGILNTDARFLILGLLAAQLLQLAGIWIWVTRAP